LWIDDVGVVPGLPLLWKVHVCTQENQVGDGLGRRLGFRQMQRGRVNKISRFASSKIKWVVLWFESYSVSSGCIVEGS